MHECMNAWMKQEQQLILEACKQIVKIFPDIHPSFIIVGCGKWQQSNTFFHKVAGHELYLMLTNLFNVKSESL